jgi:teichuronic acid biosynthesis glycosyltransferase TuaC
LHILTFTTLFPNTIQPLHGIFVQARMECFTRKYQHEWTIVAPVPYFPKLPFVIRRHWHNFARIPFREVIPNGIVYHPRYLVTPKVGMRFYGRWMALASRAIVRRVCEARTVSLIDGHYIYPDGTAAVTLGRELGIPVVLSARGSDLNLYPRFKFLIPQIKANLKACRQVICVCSELRRVALDYGASEEHTIVVGNGIDSTLFHLSDQSTARTNLGIPLGSKVFISVGHMIERKGFHILIEAFAGMHERDLILVIIGDGIERRRLEGLVRHHRLEHRVLMPGSIPNQQLPQWYSASDVFLLASSREGWPNVVCEAQATGLPVVATAVWGIPEIVNASTLGILVSNRTASAFAVAMEQSLQIPWDRSLIESMGQRRTWDKVADQLANVFASRQPQ